MRSVFPIVANQALSVLLGLLGMKLISHHVAPAVNSDWGLFLSLAQVGMLVTHSGILNHATRYWQREKGVDPAAYVRFLWGAAWRQALWLMPLLLVACAAEAARVGNSAWFLVFPFLFLGNMGLSFNGAGTGLLNVDGKAWKILFLNLTGTLARVILPIVLLLAFVPQTPRDEPERSLGASFLALAGGYAIHALVILAMCWMFFRWARKGTPVSEARRVDWRRELRDYGRPFLFLGIGTWVTMNIDRWIAAAFFSKTFSGYFNFDLQLGAIVPQMAVTVMMQLFFPSVFRAADHARTLQDWRGIVRKCDWLTAGFAGLSIAGLAVLHFAAPLLPNALLSAKYAEALPMIIPAGLVMVNSQINQFHYLLLQGQHNSAGMVWVMLVTSAVKAICGAAAAAVSLEAFLLWLTLAPLISVILGRSLILRMTFRGLDPSDASRQSASLPLREPDSTRHPGGD